MDRAPLTNAPRQWDFDYKTLETTYEDKIINNRTDFVLNMLYELIFETIVRRLDVSESFKTLECGCGGARVSVYLAKQGADVCCLDNSPEAIRLAKNNFRKEEVPFDLLTGDVEQMPFCDDVFDVVMSYGLLEHFVNIKRPFAEMTRVLKAGGISVHTIIPKKFSLCTAANLWNFTLGLLVHIRDRKFEGMIRNSRRNFPHFENRYTKKQYLAAMESTGLTECSITGITAWAPFILPKKWNPKVLNLAVKNKNSLKRFDRSRSRLTDILAPVLFAVGRKQ